MYRDNGATTDEITAQMMARGFTPLPPEAPAWVVGPDGLAWDYEAVDESTPVVPMKTVTAAATDGEDGCDDAAADDGEGDDDEPTFDYGKRRTMASNEEAVKRKKEKEKAQQVCFSF